MVAGCVSLIAVTALERFPLQNKCILFVRGLEARKKSSESLSADLRSLVCVNEFCFILDTLGCLKKAHSMNCQMQDASITMSNADSLSLHSRWTSQEIWPNLLL